VYAQTYERGLGGEPGNEAHGGYTFCGLAALMLVDQAHQLDLPRLVHWAVHMQVSMQSAWPICDKSRHCSPRYYCLEFTDDLYKQSLG